MTVNEMTRALSWDVGVLPDPDRAIDGVYCGDLLSWVMGRAQSGNLWITIMSNINVIAVASLADVSCVVLAEGATLPPDVLQTAEQKGINVLTSSLPIYETALAVSRLLSP
ncbi:MAG: hypothetical protein J6X61_06560 [Clostridia bacterium]|nr:hypothetical protein [Clostridia bacterium]